ncbi:MAG: hypothetical protein OEV62_11125 [Actinomycetota bacterium]|nr:hypothetical protein [Actinomycetota bacterium]
MGRVDEASAVPAEPGADHRALAAELAAIGYLASGSVIAATTTCSSRGCHCRLDPARRHGPYWQWSRSVDGRRRTQRVSEAQARLLQGWIANRRRAEAILSELEALSLRAVPSLGDDQPSSSEGFVRGKYLNQWIPDRRAHPTGGPERVAKSRVDPAARSR